jgi:hypothetical protein
MREPFIEQRFQKKSLVNIERANAIIAEYQKQGFTLTLRQLYYQFVARDFIQNTTLEYGALGHLMKHARNAGLVDWSAIEDRSRAFQTWLTWDDPEECLRDAAETYTEDLWNDQPNHVELWVEKDALAGIFDPVCREYQVPLLAHRGNNSTSLMYEGGKRLAKKISLGRKPIMLHFGDHDPTGISLTRDVRKRLSLYAREDIEVRRLALNMDQVALYGPPPNFAKETDKLLPAYAREFGTRECWELDALAPTVLDRLARDAIVALIDVESWNAAHTEAQRNKQLVEAAADNWGEVTRFLEGK